MSGTGGNGRRRVALGLAAVLVLALAACEDVPYVSPADPETLPPKARRVVDIYVPPEGVRTPDMPVVMWVHGGGFIEGCEDAPGHPNDCPPDESWEPLWTPLEYVEQGAVVVSVRYRLAGTMIDADGDPTTPAQRPARHRDLVQDIDAAVRWIRDGGLQAAIPDVDIDPNKLVAWGWSAGANLVAQQALGTYGPVGAPSQRPDRLVLFAGAFRFDDADVRGELEDKVPGLYATLFGCVETDTPEDDPICHDAVVEGSLVHPSKEDAVAGFPPTYIVHGALDSFVDDFHSTELWFVLTLAGRDVVAEYPTCVEHDMLERPLQEGVCQTTDLPPTLPIGYDSAAVGQRIFDWP